MRTILQSETSECGLACLAMICASHGKQIELYELRRLFRTSSKGATLPDLMHQASNLGLASRPIRADIANLPDIKTPAILHWDFNHFVVLRKATRKFAIIGDPARGTRRVSMQEISDSFTGIALELSPSDSFRQASNSKRISIWSVIGPIEGITPALLKILIVGVALQAIAIVGPWYSQFVIDDVIASGDRDLLATVMVGFSIMLALHAALSIGRSWMTTALTQELSLQWATRLFEHLLRLPCAFFERRSPSEILSRFGSIDAVQRTLTVSALESLIDGVMATIAFVLMFVYSPVLAFVSTTAIALACVLRIALHPKLRAAAAERIVLQTKESSLLLETFKAIASIKLNTHEAARLARWQNIKVQIQNRDAETIRIGYIASAAQSFLFGLENVLVIGLGAKLAMNSGSDQGANFTVGMLMAFLGYKGQVLSRVMAVIAFIGDWRMLDLHAERLSDVALSEPENTAINRIRPIRGIITESNSESIANDVIFEAQNLGLRYSDSEPWIFREVDLAIRRGECVAIIGKSGCGKSSLLKAILGLYPATEGRMFAFGHSIKNLRESAFSEQIGVVLQDDCIVYGSVAENVSFHSENVDEGRLVEACKIACIHDDIERMPMRYETVLNESGTGLSGGQRQRILLARALYRRPTVLILDEATSHLDSATEARINHALDAASLTRLIIAHRPQTISSASRVLTLSEIGLQNYRTD